MAFSNDPREDLAYIDTELQKPMGERSRDALLDARRRTVQAIAEQEHGLVCPDCEEGPDDCRCVAYDDIRPVRGEAA